MHIRDDANWIGQSARVSYYGRVEEEEETYSQRRGSGSVNLFRWTHCCLYLCAVQSVCLYLLTIDLCAYYSWPCGGPSFYYYPIVMQLQKQEI